MGPPPQKPGTDGKWDREAGRLAKNCRGAADAETKEARTPGFFSRPQTGKICRLSNITAAPCQGKCRRTACGRVSETKRSAITPCRKTTSRIRAGCVPGDERGSFRL